MNPPQNGDSSASGRGRPGRLLVWALGLILAGDLLAWAIQTGGGTVAVRDLRWVGSGGTRMSALLYVPDGATAETPAPGIVAIHGYINSRETQDGFAIEFARRGFVVLAVDQTGHGYSDPPAFAHGFGGPDALAYLRTLDIVDPDNIGLEGHSMGGWAALIAAARAPDDYRAIVIEGSSTGSSGAPDATATWPRNLAVVFSKYDEFSGAMWGSPVAAEVPASEKARAAFGTAGPVEVGRVYGSIEAGTARVFHQPPVIHPADHFSRAAIGHAIDWFQRTLEGGRPLPPHDQVWYWKEAGNLVALVGMVLLLFAVGEALLATRVFADLAGPLPPSTAPRGAGWWAAAAVFALLPAATLFPFKDLGGRLRPSAVLPQAITNQVVVWALLTAALSLLLFAGWWVRRGGRDGAGPDTLGLTWSGRADLRRVGRSVLLAGLIALSAYATLLASAFFFTVDFRFWVFAVKPMSPVHLRAAAVYVVPFTLFFVAYGLVLFAQLRRGGSLAADLVRAVAVSTAGFVALIAVQYVPLFLGGTLALPSEPLWSIVAFQFVPLMAIGGLVTAYYQRRTGHLYVGAALSGILVTWIVVASQATHVAP